MAIFLINEACNAGARLKLACEVLEIGIRTWQRWIKDSSLKDKRCGPVTAPGNKFTTSERSLLLEIVNSSEYRNQPACQIVPSLADGNDILALYLQFYAYYVKRKCYSSAVLRNLVSIANHQS